MTAGAPLDVLVGDGGLRPKILRSIRRKYLRRPIPKKITVEGRDRLAAA